MHASGRPEKPRLQAQALPGRGDLMAGTAFDYADGTRHLQRPFKGLNMKPTAVLLALTAALGTFSLAHADDPDPAVMKKQMYDMGRNMSGLINHCIDKGFLKADSAENAKKMVAYVAGIPGGMDQSDGDKSEAHGRKGEALQNGDYLNLEQTSSLSLKQWCQQADEGMRQGLKSVGL
jgi:hypothetical protein